jgi:hypothetical protein
VNAELVSELEAPRHRVWRVRAVSTIAPATVLAGALWGMVQPYRITLLHPDGQGFWWLVVEPPLLVILVGLLFQVLVVPGLLRDLEEAGDAASG